MVALASVFLGVLKLAIPTIAITAAPEVLIVTGLGMLYLREAVGKNAETAVEAAKELEEANKAEQERLDEIDKRRRGIVDD